MSKIECLIPFTNKTNLSKMKNSKGGGKISEMSFKKIIKNSFCFCPYEKVNIGNQEA